MIRERCGNPCSVAKQKKSEDKNQINPTQSMEQSLPGVRSFLSSDFENLVIQNIEQQVEEDFNKEKQLLLNDIEQNFIQTEETRKVFFFFIAFEYF